jgi:hypothetical protein
VIRRLILAVCLCAAALTAHAAALLPTLTITTAVSATAATPLQFRAGVPHNATIQANFVYGSGGTSADAYVQISVDGGLTWVDVANFHFTTSSARRLYNLSSATAVTSIATPTDGSLTANTAVDGLLGTLMRVKYVTVGTYAGTTTLRVDVVGGGLTP